MRDYKILHAIPFRRFRAKPVFFKEGCVYFGATVSQKFSFATVADIRWSLAVMVHADKLDTLRLTLAKMDIMQENRVVGNSARNFGAHANFTRVGNIHVISWLQDVQIQPDIEGIIAGRVSIGVECLDHTTGELAVHYEKVEGSAFCYIDRTDRVQLPSFVGRSLRRIGVI